MSRIGQNPIKIPDDVNIIIDGNLVKVTGKKGVLEFNKHNAMEILEVDGNLIVKRDSDGREQKSLHGTTRQMINNMVIGVSDGFEKELEIVGVGYQASIEGNRLRLQIGYSHDIYFDLPEGINVTADRTIIKINGIDKQLVGSVASKIRSFRKPEPYKGKGIRYKDEYIRIKQGKTVGD